jgi:hypothetical protein
MPSKLYLFLFLTYFVLAFKGTVDHRFHFPKNVKNTEGVVRG